MCQRRRLPRVPVFGARSHGIGTGCLRFAVRVSPPHARLASGCWPSSTGRDSFTRRVATKGFRVRVSSSLPELAGRYDTGFPPPAEGPEGNGGEFPAEIGV